MNNFLKNDQVAVSGFYSDYWTPLPIFVVCENVAAAQKLIEREGISPIQPPFPQKTVHD